MNRSKWLALLVLGAACQEYEFHSDNAIYATPNPPVLETPVQQDRIVQVTVPSVDVLWVIDDSGSMYEEQTLLVENFTKFMNYFISSGLDYHIGVVSTDMYDYSKKGKLQSGGTGALWVDESTSNPIETFQAMASLGTSGSADERGRAAAWTALNTERDAFNSGFYRDDASLSVIVISDEDDYSGASPISKTEFISWLQTLKVDEEMVNFSSIVGPRGGGCYSPSTDAVAGTQYLDVTDAVGGISWSICDPDWDQVLEQLGMQAAGLKREFFLSEIPIEETIVVWEEKDGELVENWTLEDYEYNAARNSIKFFTHVPDPLNEVFVEYERLAAKQDASHEASDTDE